MIVDITNPIVAQLLAQHGVEMPDMNYPTRLAHCILETCGQLQSAAHKVLAYSAAVPSGRVPQGWNESLDALLPVLQSAHAEIFLAITHLKGWSTELDDLAIGIQKISEESQKLHAEILRQQAEEAGNGNN